MLRFLKSLNKKYYALTVFVVIVLFYLYPAFLGKVDTPLDIRNTYMYPWRYHEVDKKINVIELWKYSGGSANIIELKPQSSSTQIHELKIEQVDLNIDKGNFYFTFNLKKEPEDNDKAVFLLQLFNKATNQPVDIPYTYSPVIAQDFLTWYKAYFSLDKVLQNLSSLSDLNKYNVQLVAENNHSDLNAKYTFANLKLVCDDRSSVSTVKNFYINDLVQMFTPFREYYSNALKKGKIPFWNNYTFTGTEFIAEPQIGYFHPLYLISYFLFDHFSAHLFILFVCLVLCGFGAYLLARYWGLGFAASIFAGLVYMFHPFNAKWLSYEHVLLNSATLPYLLLMYEKYLKEKYILNKYLIFSILLTGLIFISGHLQKVYYALFFFFLFIMFRFILNVILAKQNPVKILISSVLIFGIGLLIGSIVLVQFFPLFLHSHREPFSGDFIKAASIPLKAFIGLIYPFYGGHSGDENLDPKYVAGFFRNYVYFGLLPFVCALFSLKIIFKNKLVLFFFLSILFSILVSIGSPLLFILQTILPGFKQMQHFRFIEIYSFCVPFLAGMGFQLFADLLNGLNTKVRSVIVLLLIVITSFDLMFYSSYFISWNSREDYKKIYKGGAIEYLLKQKQALKEPFRVLPFSVSGIGDTKLKVNVSQPNILMPFELEEVSGYSSFAPKDIYSLFVYVQTKDPSKLYSKEILNLFENPNIPYPIFNFKSKILDLLNVKYFMVPSIITLQAEKVRKVFDGDAAIYENLNCLPRAFVVSNYKIIEDPKETIVYLDSEEFKPQEVVVLMNEPVIVREQSGLLRTFGARNDIEFVNYEPENIKLKIEIDNPGFLVLGHNFNNNWKVKVNDKEEKLLKANLVQSAVYLPKTGSYKVEFYYFPKLFMIGLVLSLVGIVVLFVMAWMIRMKFRNREK